MGEFAWPAGLVAIAVVFMLVFKTPVAAMIGRIRRLSRQGAELNPPEQPASQSVQDKSQAALFDIASTPVIKEQEQMLLKELDDRGIKESQARELALVRSLALTIL